MKVVPVLCPVNRTLGLEEEKLPVCVCVHRRVGGWSVIKR